MPAPRVFHAREGPAFSVLWRKRHQRRQEVRAYLTGGGDVSWECTVWWWAAWLTLYPRSPAPSPAYARAPIPLSSAARWRAPRADRPRPPALEQAVGDHVAGNILRTVGASEYAACSPDLRQVGAGLGDLPFVTSRLK